jgi:hypothetical protein
LTVSALHLALEYATPIGAILLVVSGILNAVLILVLNSTFDPERLSDDARRDRNENRLRQRFMRASEYAVSVVRNNDPDYDYRGRVGPSTVVLCKVYVFFVALTATCGLVWGILWVLGRLTRK